MPTIKQFVNPTPICQSNANLSILDQSTSRTNLPIHHEFTNPGPTRQSHVNPGQIYQSTNPRPICQSWTNLSLHHKSINPVPIQYQSANPMQICQSSANLPIQCQSLTNLPIHYQSINPILDRSGNPMSILHQSVHPLAIQDQSDKTAANLEPPANLLPICQSNTTSISTSISAIHQNWIGTGLALNRSALTQVTSIMRQSEDNCPKNL